MIGKTQSLSHPEDEPYIAGCMPVITCPVSATDTDWEKQKESRNICKNQSVGALKKIADVLAHISLFSAESHFGV